MIESNHDSMKNKRRGSDHSSTESVSSASPAFSVIICTHGRDRELDRCLEAVSRLNYSQFDIVVVDSAPHNSGAFEIARRWGVTYVMEPRIGLSRARNVGLRASSGEIVAFLDDDAVPDPNWLQNLAAEFNDSRVAAVAGRIQELRASTKPRSDVAEFFLLDCLGDQRQTIDQDDPQWFEKTNFGGVGQGSNMAFRRSALCSWAGFDNRLGRGALITGSEEHHAFFTLVGQGYRVVYAPDPVVYHPCPGDMRSLRQHFEQQLTASTGYMTLLFVEEPHHRKRLMRYVWEALRGMPRTWRTTPSNIPAGIVSRCRRYYALSRGPFFYLRARLSRARIVRASTLLVPDIPSEQRIGN